MKRPVRVIIADDQPTFAAMLEAVLGDDPRIEVVGRAENGEEAVALAGAVAPDVILMDITMPVLDGLEATRRLREQGSPAHILILTESDFRGDVVRAERAGADGYVPKTRIGAGLRDAILDAA